MNILKSKPFLLGAIFVSIIFVGLPLLLIPLNKYLGLPFFDNLFFKIIGVLFIVVGFGVVIYSTVQHIKTGRKTPLPVVEQPRQFIVNGLYKFCRNPMYLSWILIYFGIFLLLGYFLLFLFTVLVFLFFHLFVVNIEEPELYHVFGEQYENYVNKVPRWIIKISKKF